MFALRSHYILFLASDCSLLSQTMSASGIIIFMAHSLMYLMFFKGSVVNYYLTIGG